MTYYFALMTINTVAFLANILCYVSYHGPVLQRKPHSLQAILVAVVTVYLTVNFLKVGNDLVSFVLITVANMGVVSRVFSSFGNKSVVIDAGDYSLDALIALFWMITFTTYYAVYY